MRKLSLIIGLCAFLSIIKCSAAEQNLAQKLAGRILLQVQSHGEAWYVNPADLKKYYLGRPQDAFDLMRSFGIGITDAHLDKIAIGAIESSDDNDRDGLSNRLENAIGTNPQDADSDFDGFDDQYEIKNYYNPSGTGRYAIDSNFAAKNAGKIFLQVEKNGEAWYVNPTDRMRYYLGRPSDAFALMRILGLGITNGNIANIATGQLNLNTNNQQTCSGCQTNSAEQIFSVAADAIRSGKTEEVKSYFTKDMEKALEYTMNFLNNEGKLALGNILSGSKLTSLNDNEKIYTNKIYFSLGGYEVPIKFILKKQADGRWLMTNL